MSNELSVSAFGRAPHLAVVLRAPRSAPGFPGAHLFKPDYVPAAAARRTVPCGVEISVARGRLAQPHGSHDSHRPPPRPRAWRARQAVTRSHLSRPRAVCCMSDFWLASIKADLMPGPPSLPFLAPLSASQASRTRAYAIHQTPDARDALTHTVHRASNKCAPENAQV